jgi:hypothetical protein
LAALNHFTVPFSLTTFLLTGLVAVRAAWVLQKAKSYAHTTAQLPSDRLQRAQTTACNFLNIVAEMARQGKQKIRRRLIG